MSCERVYRHFYPPKGGRPQISQLSRGLPAMHYRSSRPTRLTIGALVTSCAIALTTITAPAVLAVEATATIADVQGTTSASPLVGSTVTVEGVVTADYRGASGYQGIVIQTPGSGGASA